MNVLNQIPKQLFKPSVVATALRMATIIFITCPQISFFVFSAIGIFDKRHKYNTILYGKQFYYVLPSVKNI